MWVKIDDRFDEHRKFQSLSAAAGFLWFKCLAYCNRNETDGHIPRVVAEERAYSLDPASPGSPPKELVDAGLWEATPTGYYFHDYPKYQLLKADLQALRVATAQRKERWRNARRNVVPNAVTDGVGTHAPVSRIPLPVVPVPDTEKKTTLGHADARPAVENPQDPDEITADQAFDEVFWPAYPRKVAKRRARKAWKALKLKDSDEELLERIMGALSRDKAKEWYNREPDKIPHPATWINDRRWEDG